MLQRAFPDRATHDIDFTVDAVVQYDVPVIKILFKVAEIYKSFQITFGANI